MNTRDIPGFSAEDTQMLSRFCKEGTHALTREVDPFRVGAVLEKLIRSTAVDMRAITGFHPMQFHAPVEGVTPENPATLQMPVDATDVECIQIAEILDMHPLLRGERSGLREMSHVSYSLHFDSLFAYLHEKFGKTGMRFVNMLYSTAARDTFHNWRKAQKNLQRFEDIEHAELGIEMIWKFSPQENTYEESDMNAVQPFTGFALSERLKKVFEKNFPKAIDTCVRLLVKSEDLQQRALLMLQNMRLIPQSYVAEAMVRQGYRTLAKMEEMTEYDVWDKIKKEKERTALHIMNVKQQSIPDIQSEIEKMRAYLHSAVAQTAPGNERQLDRLNRNIAFIDRQAEKIHSVSEGISIPLDVLNKHDQAMWEKASDYLQTHEPQPRRSLKDVIGCDAYREELRTLRSMNQWNALAAKEREIVQKIFSEAMLFAYEYDSREGESYKERAHTIGTPAYALQKRKVNCFTWTWLVATLCMEAGIDYSKLYYCSVNRSNNTNAEVSSAHCSLLIHYSDATLASIDTGLHTCNQILPLQCIPDVNERRELTHMISTAGRVAKTERQKIHTYPVRVRLPKATADTLHLNRDMHVLPLDQGFAASALLNTGVAFEKEGKKAEAKAAYELGLVSHPADTNLLCRLAVLAIQEKDFLHAGHLLELALAANEDHLHSLYYSGLLAWHQGDKAKACQFFIKVADDPRTVWDDGTFKQKAVEYVERLKGEILRDRRESNYSHESLAEDLDEELS